MQREFFQDEVSPVADLVFVGCSLAEATGPCRRPAALHRAGRWSWAAVGSKPLTCTRTVLYRKPWP
jgi:hypothetical protein